MGELASTMIIFLILAAIIIIVIIVIVAKGEKRIRGYSFDDKPSYSSNILVKKPKTEIQPSKPINIIETNTAPSSTPPPKPVVRIKRRQVSFIPGRKRKLSILQILWNVLKTIVWIFTAVLIFYLVRSWALELVFPPLVDQGASQSPPPIDQGASQSPPPIDTSQLGKNLIKGMITIGVLGGLILVIGTYSYIVIKIFDAVPALETIAEGFLWALIPAILIINVIDAILPKDIINVPADTFLDKTIIPTIYTISFCILLGLIAYIIGRYIEVRRKRAEFEAADKILITEQDFLITKGRGGNAKKQKVTQQKKQAPVPKALVIFIFLAVLYFLFK